MKQSAKRLISMFLALIFLAAAFVIFFEVIQPAYAQVELLRGQLAGESQSLASEKALVAQAKNLITSFNQGSAAQANVALAVPDGQDVAGALAQVEGIAANNNITIANIGISAPALADESQASGNGSGRTAPAVSPLGSFTLSLSGSGSYENFKAFLEQIETNIRIFDLKDLSLTPAPVLTATGKVQTSGNADAFNYAITIETYYQISNE